MALLHFTRDIERLKKKFLSLFAMVDEALHGARTALLERDGERAAALIAADKRIDLLEVEVEEDCLKILVLHQPVAHDLRYVNTILKINRDLERVGDQAVAIARITLSIRDAAALEVPAELRELMDRATRMMKEAFDSVINLDAELARSVWIEDDEADALAECAVQTIRERIEAHPEQTATLLEFYSLAFLLERIADHATNIAKDVLYTVKGEIVRHRGKEFKKPGSEGSGA